MNTNQFNISQYILSSILIFIDLFILMLALYFTLLIESTVLYISIIEHISHYYWILFLSIFMLIMEKIYFVRNDFWGDMKRIFKALFFSFFAVFTMMTLTNISCVYSVQFIVTFFIISAILLPLFKRISKKIIFRFNIFKLNIHIVASGEQKDILLAEIQNNWFFGFKHSEDAYDIVIISSNSFAKDELEGIIANYSNKTRDIYVVPYMDHLDFSHASIIDYSNIRLSAIHIENRLLNYRNIFIKYIFEKTVVLLIFPFALLLHIFISALIKFDSEGKVIFKQKRLGKDANVFSCYKYRTMYTNSQDLLESYLRDNPDEQEYYSIYHKYQNDPRVTKLGRMLRKTSLDEFPQFYNILQGKMNLIGPRPYMLTEKAKIGKNNEKIILKVRPGITGLWQVSGRNNLSFGQRVNLDSWYIQNWSLWMDFVILLKTLKVVLLKVGVK